MSHLPPEHESVVPTKQSSLQIPADVIFFLHNLLDTMRARLNEPHNQEFGADWREVQFLSEQVERLRSYLGIDLGPFQDLSKQDLTAVNPIFSMLDKAEQLHTTLTHIRRSRTSSTGNSAALQRGLASLWKYLAELWQQTGQEQFPDEDQLVSLEAHLKNNAAHETRWESFIWAQARLKAAWHSGGDSIPDLLAHLDKIALRTCHVPFREVEPPTASSESDDPTIPPYEEPLPLQNYWAIVAGASNFHDTTFGGLPYTANDASLIAQRMLSTRRGYARERLALLCADADTFDGGRLAIYGRAERSSLWEAIRLFADQVAEDDLLLFYFSGHGTVYRGKAYLILEDTRDHLLDKTAIAMDELKAELLEAKAKAKIIILDTCHAGAIHGEGKSDEPMSADFIADVSASAEGVVIITSCRADERSFPYDSYRKTSAFTYFLLECLSQEGQSKAQLVTTSTLERYISTSFRRWSSQGRRQRPIFFRKATGDIPIGDWRQTGAEEGL